MWIMCHILNCAAHQHIATYICEHTLIRRMEGAASFQHSISENVPRIYNPIQHSISK